MDEIAIRHLIDETRAQRLTLFIGGELSGVLTGVPSHRQLAKQLAAEYQLSETNSNILPEVAQDIGAGRYNALLRFLSEKLDSTGLPPQPFDRFVARLPVQTIITTRYDDLLEKAFSLAGKPFVSLVSELDIVIQSGNRSRLVKLYGDLRQPASLTIIQNDLLTLSIQKPGLTQLLMSALNGTLLLLGHDLNSPTFRSLWAEMLLKLGRYAPTAYAAFEYPPSDAERKRAEQNKILLLDMPAFALVQLLSERLSPVDSATKSATDNTSGWLPSLPPPIEQFYNFDLELARKDDRFIARVLSSPEGVSEEAMTGVNELPATFDSLKSIAGVDQLIASVLLPPRVRARWEANLAVASREQKGVRLRLRVADLALADIPWESAMLDDRRPALHLATPFIRSVPAARRVESLKVEGMLRALVVLVDSAAIGLHGLSEQLERAVLEKALHTLQKAGKIELHWLTGKVTPAKLLETVRRVQPHLLHVVGHGEMQTHENRSIGGLYFAKTEDAEEGAAWVNAEQLALIFDGSPLRFALLNGCQSGRAAGGVAEALVKSSFAAAVGMQANVPDSVAVQFADTFYRTLADGWPIDLAVTEARRLLSLLLGLESPFWSLPVLYMHAQQGQLFAT